MKPYDQVPDNEMWAKVVFSISRHGSPNYLHNSLWGISSAYMLTECTGSKGKALEASEYGFRETDSLNDSKDQCSLPIDIAIVT